VGYVARLGEIKNAYKILVGKPEGNIPHGEPRNRWEDSIKIGLHLKEIECAGLDLLI
jgi:hypothetical protein